MLWTYGTMGRFYGCFAVRTTVVRNLGSVAKATLKVLL